MSGRRAPAVDLLDAQLERRTLATAIVNREAVAQLASLPRDAFAGEYNAALRDAIVAADAATPQAERLDGVDLGGRFAAAARIGEYEALCLLSEWIGPVGNSSLSPQLGREAFERACQRLATLAQQRAVAREVWLAARALEDGTGSVAALEDARAALERLDREGSALAPIEGSPIVQRMADIAARPVDWLWHGRIPRGCVTVLAGRPGDGKSFAATDWAARVSAGRAWPDDAPCDAGDVLLVSGEDDPETTIRPRLDAHGADAARVHLLRAVNRSGRNGQPVQSMFTLFDLPALETALSRLPAPRLCIIDPLGSFLGGRVDAHRDNEVRAVLAPVALLAERYGVAVLAIAHHNKSSAGRADDLILGSRAFSGIARAVLHLLRDPDDEERRLVLPGKFNLARKPTGLAFRIDGQPARLAWESDPVELSADGVLSAMTTRRSATRGAVDDCQEWMHGELVGRSEGWPATELEQAARAAGFSVGTYRRARQALATRTWKDGLNGGWRVALPAGSPEDAQALPCDPGIAHLAHLRAKPEIFPKMRKVRNGDGGTNDLRTFDPDAPDGVESCWPTLVPADDAGGTMGGDDDPRSVEALFAEST